MDYNELIERLKKETYWNGGGEPYSKDIHPVICDEAVTAITDLISRAEAAEARAEKAEREKAEAIGNLSMIVKFAYEQRDAAIKVLQSKEEKP